MDRLHDSQIDVKKFKMAKPPREYQAKTIEMLKLRGGILCADVVGLGKRSVDKNEQNNAKD